MRTNRTRWAVAAVLVLVTGIAACGSGRSSTDSAPESATSSSEGNPPIVASDTSAGPTTTLPVPEGVTLAATFVSDNYWSVRTIAHNDEYLELSAPGGTLMISRSTDGATWTPSPTDHTIDGVALVASNGDELFVSSGWGSSESQPPTVSVSADGGAAWTTSPLPIPEPASPYVVADSNVSALAATDGAALALGTVFLRGDWQLYSADVLGVDHGQVTGEGGDPLNWTVEFEDGFDLTVDLTEIGMPELAAGLGPLAIAWLRTGATWEIVALPFSGSSVNPIQLVAGPAGFLTVGPPAEQSMGPQTAKLYRSADGRKWETGDLPEGFSMSEMLGSVFLAAGPLGYVIIGETALAFSADGVTWSTVAEFDDLSPDTSGFLSAYPPAGGPAGFAVPFADGTGSGGAPRILVSRDGQSWEPVLVGAPAFDAMVAVSEDSILVRPVAQPSVPGADIPVDTSVIAAGPGVGGAGGRRPAAMCESPESVTLVAYDLETGAYRWHLCGTDVWYALEAVTEDAVYVSDITSGSSSVIALDSETGEEFWRGTEDRMAGELPEDPALPMETPPELEGLRLEGGQDDPLVVSDPATGQTIWSVPDILAYDDVWAVGDDAVYMAHIGESKGAPFTWTLRAYEVQTGDVRWEVEPTGESYPWWVADGRVFSMWADLTVLSTDSGEVLWATDYDTPTFPGMRGVLANDDTVFVTFASHWGGGD